MPNTKKHSTKYTPEFKTSVIMDMLENDLSHRETVRKYWFTKTRAEEDNYCHQLRSWQKIFVEKGAAGFLIERRGEAKHVENRKKSEPKKKCNNSENDTVAELQRLRERNEYLEMENAYLKKLRALVRAEEQKNGKKSQ